MALSAKGIRGQTGFSWLRIIGSSSQAFMNMVMDSAEFTD
jgi:hypothetical protein